jgi:hypothetical protein
MDVISTREPGACLIVRSSSDEGREGRLENGATADARVRVLFCSVELQRPSGLG